eukprot:1892040-Pleurochrysis_carterae.AAC.1
MCLAELDRRSSANAAAQYVDLFRRAWRAAYVSLAALMPATSSGQDALSFVGVLANATHSVATITEPIVAGLDQRIAPLLSLLETAELRSAPDAIRVDA